METSYFTELFSRKKDEFCIHIMNKKVSKESKCQKKTKKKSKKNHNDKNKKEGILFEAGALYTARGIFQTFHSCDSHMYESPLFKNDKKFPYFCMFLCIFALFLSFSLFFSLVLAFFEWRSCIHVLEHELQCYYYLYILYNLFTCIYMYK